MITIGEQATHRGRTVKLIRSIGIIETVLKIQVSLAEDRKLKDRCQDRFQRLSMTKNQATQTAQY